MSTLQFACRRFLLVILNLLRHDGGSSEAGEPEPGKREKKSAFRGWQWSKTERKRQLLPASPTSPITLQVFMRRINKQTSREKQALPMLTDGVRIQRGCFWGVWIVRVCVCVSDTRGGGGPLYGGPAKRESERESGCHPRPLIGLFVPVKERERRREGGERGGEAFMSEELQPHDGDRLTVP